MLGKSTAVPKYTESITKVLLFFRQYRSNGTNQQFIWEHLWGKYDSSAEILC